jgi:hypothetical protein
MTMLNGVLINLLIIAVTCAIISYLIMRLTFHPKIHPKLVEGFQGINTAGLNSGAIILLSLSIAFIFNDISETRSQAKLSVIKEADALRTLGRASLNIDPAIGSKIMVAAREYTSMVIEKEWPAIMNKRSADIKSGQSSALQPLTVLSDLVYAPEHLAKLPNATSMQLSSLITKIREQRLNRIDSSEFTIGIRGVALGAITLFASLTILSLANLTRKPTQLVSTFMLLLVTVSAMYIIFKTQNPFNGLDYISDQPLREALDRLINMKLTRHN